MKIGVLPWCSHGSRRRAGRSDARERRQRQVLVRRNDLRGHCRHGRAAGGRQRRAVGNGGLSATQIYRDAALGVVSIRARTAAGEDEGAGIVLDGRGLILTNDHVVAGAEALAVSAGGAQRVARRP